MTYGWNTKKTATGYAWSVTSFEYGVGSTTLHTGECATRTKAARTAKRHVIPYRRAARVTP